MVPRRIRCVRSAITASTIHGSKPSEAGYCSVSIEMLSGINTASQPAASTLSASSVIVCTSPCGMIKPYFIVFLESFLNAYNVCLIKFSTCRTTVRCCSLSVGKRRPDNRISRTIERPALPTSIEPLSVHMNLSIGESGRKYLLLVPDHSALLYQRYI